MALQKLSDADFMAEFELLGATALARKHKMDLRWVNRRRRSVEKRYGRLLKNELSPSIEYPQRAILNIQDGEVLVGSDLHAWPGQRSVAFRAFLKFCKDRKPRAVIMNGDVMDFPQISRHTSIGWENRPSVQDEIEYAQSLLGEIEKAAFQGREDMDARQPRYAV